MAEASNRADGSGVASTREPEVSEVILDALRTVYDPCCKEKEISVVDMGLIESVDSDREAAKVELVLASGWCPFAARRRCPGVLSGPANRDAPPPQAVRRGGVRRQGVHRGRARQRLRGTVGHRGALDRTTPAAHGRDDRPAVRHDDRPVPARIRTRNLSSYAVGAEYSFRSVANDQNGACS